MRDTPSVAPAVKGMLGDTPARDYSRKLKLFAAFAEKELRRAIGSFAVQPGMRVLDAGCGAGDALRWLLDEVGPDGIAVGFDLATAHVASASSEAPGAFVLQADLQHPPFRARTFDFVWCVNTLNHLRDPVKGLESLAALLRPGGRVVLGQSSFLPEMFFAWDARLERLVTEAVRQYYRDRYSVSERDLAQVRSLLGWFRAARLRDVAATTFSIERISPLQPADEAYLLEAIFRDTWGPRLQPYLSAADYAELRILCDPDHAGFALRRPDFHFLQTFTLVSGAN
jgi:SAM-dependent methyltransferase